MDTWQAWASVLVGFVLSFIAGDRIFEKRRAAQRNDDMYEKLNALTKEQAKLSERIVRVESEIMTEREVREILSEFMTPFLAQLSELNKKSDNINEQITQLRINLARGNKSENSDI